MLNHFIENKIYVPTHFNYVGIFLTLACNLKCSYCINHLSGPAQRVKLMGANEWRNFFQRLVMPQTVRLTLQGGEPSIHPHFYEIVNSIPDHIDVDLLSNAQFDAEEFCEKINPKKFKPHEKYPAIRISYHPETMDLEMTLEKVKLLAAHGYSIGIYSVLHPSQCEVIENVSRRCEELGIFFKTKEFLGVYNSRIYGEFKHKDAVFSKKLSACECKTSEFLVSPTGASYRCHSDLYNAINSQGAVSEDSFTVASDFKYCDQFGNCNPCDIKIKNNRFQQFGHTSVEIRNLNVT